MPETWMSVAAAATALNCHTRTIERRIASNKIQSRRTDDGQLQVLIDVSDTLPPNVNPLETVRELAQDQISLATGSASAIVRLAQADADRVRGELELVRQDARRARQGARLAWISVATMAAAICIAVGWTTHRVTQSNDRINALNMRAQQIESESNRLLAESTDARSQVTAARIAQAEAAAKLAAYQEQAQKMVSDNHPTTKPVSSLLQRIASLWEN